MDAVEMVKAAAARLNPDEQYELFRWWIESDAFRQHQLAILKRKMAEGMEHLKNGQYREYSEASVIQLAEEICQIERQMTVQYAPFASRAATVEKVEHLYEAIQLSTGERNVHKQLETCPRLMLRLFERNRGGYVISHFDWGNEFQTDFVVLTPYSGGCDIYFVELEPPNQAAFNKAGDYSPRLNHAAGQIRKWKMFVEQSAKRAYLISQLLRAVQERDLLQDDKQEPVCSAGFRLDDSRVMLSFHFKVIMGRRDHLDSDALLKRKAGLQSTDGFELITYDRILELATIIDPSEL